MTKDEYVAAATIKAEEIMPGFVNKVIDIISDEEDNIALSPLAVFADKLSDYTTITQVNSFDTSNIGSDGDMALNISKSLVLQPGNTGYVYAAEGWIWVADQGWVWNLEEGKYAEQTMLLGFRLDGASSTFAAVGSVPGSLLNQFSIDFVKDKEDGKEYVRIATTQTFVRNVWWDPRPMMDFVMEEPSTTEAEAEQDMEDESRTLNQIIIFEIPKVEESNNALVELGSVELGKKDEVSTRQ